MTIIIDFDCFTNEWIEVIYGICKNMGLEMTRIKYKIWQISGNREKCQLMEDLLDLGSGGEILSKTQI